MPGCWKVIYGTEQKTCIGKDGIVKTTTAGSGKICLAISELCNSDFGFLTDIGKCTLESC